MDYLRVAKSEVMDSFRRYNLLDSNVEFHKGVQVAHHSAVP